ncbi:hypothetical protein NDU88_001352 [Pleurodeles waltl]|uniref:Uncharacterized protein n=1 Tax=Pleurodeles waltl TaxID=8319 RepID=A0AAV7R9I6_PLEWA|nr:hypothetical protein NDU88_001352 [Pleurodeles waltl]
MSAARLVRPREGPAEALKAQKKKQSQRREGPGRAARAVLGRRGRSDCSPPRARALPRSPGPLRCSGRAGRALQVAVASDARACLQRMLVSTRKSGC